MVILQFMTGYTCLHHENLISVTLFINTPFKTSFFKYTLRLEANVFAIISMAPCRGVSAVDCM